MSRCFPFPTPGYEKKEGNSASNNHVDLLAKVQRTEKQKKEKKDKEKEGKKRKDKDRSKDRHREKKEQKEKHKKKDKDKGESRTFEDRSGNRSLPHAEDKHERSWKTEDIKRSKFSDELNHRIRDDENTSAAKIVSSFASTHQRSCNGTNCEAAKDMERVVTAEVHPASTGSHPRRVNGTYRPAEIFPSSIKKCTEFLGPANAPQKEQNSLRKLVPDLSQREQRGNGGKERPAVCSTVFIQQRSDHADTAFIGKHNFEHRKVVANYSILQPVEKQNFERTKVVANHSSKVKKSLNGTSQSGETLSNLASGKVDGIFLVKKIEKRGETKKGAPSHICLENREVEGIQRSLDKVSDKSTEWKENREVEIYDKHKKGHDVFWDAKKNSNGNLGNLEKEVLAIFGKHGEHNEFSDIMVICKLDRVDNPNQELLASRWDENKRNKSDQNKKRKAREMNGFLHENDSMSNKFQKTSSHLVENGRIADSLHTPSSTKKLEAVSKFKARQLPVDNKEHAKNGSRVAQSSAIGSRDPTVDDAKNMVSLKPPHPDSKYLSQLYNVPKMDDLPDYDDQEWLCRCSHHSKREPKLKADETCHVWADALRIDPVGVLALPYVIPL